MSLKVENLTLTRGGRTILSDVNFSAPAGACLILRGENGSGKTTLLKTLAGLLPVEAGTFHAPDEEIAYSGHLDAIKAQLTVRENLRFWAGIYDASNMDAVANTLSLSDLMDRVAGTLSAGQRRRLGLARLFLTGAKIWLMDEPTTSLDGHTTKLVAALIADHCAQGGSAILSTHVDLDIPKAQTLDLTEFAPTADQPSADPFLAGDYT